MTDSNRSALLAEMVFARRQGNFGAQIGRFNFQIEQFLMFGTQIIHRVFEHHIRLAGFDTRGQHAIHKSRACKVACTEPSRGLRSAHSSSRSTARIKASEISTP